MDQADARLGASWMPNISGCPNGAVVCSLSQVLETGEIPQRYFLSARACAGILRRAEKRGKELPPALRTALIAGARAATLDGDAKTTSTSSPPPSPPATATMDGDPREATEATT
jgi:hypothetical protein